MEEVMEQEEDGVLDDGALQRQLQQTPRATRSVPFFTFLLLYLSRLFSLVFPSTKIQIHSHVLHTHSLHFPTPLIDALPYSGQPSVKVNGSSCTLSKLGLGALPKSLKVLRDSVIRPEGPPEP